MVTRLEWATPAAYLQRLSTRSRKHFKRDIQPYQHLVLSKVVQEVDGDQLHKFYEHYKQVKARIWL